MKEDTTNETMNLQRTLLTQQHRKKPFSHKQKKNQLKKKRALKSEEQILTTRPPHENHESQESFPSSTPSMPEGGIIRTTTENSSIPTTIPTTPSHSFLVIQEKSRKAHLDMVFRKSTVKEREINLKLSREPVERPLDEKRLHRRLETSVELYHYDEEGRTLDLPKRPEWNYKMSKETVERNEQQTFHRWLDRILRCYSSEQVSYFEMNLEVWRQLWRTLEMSDVLLLIVDIRNPLVHFPPSLYSYVVDELKKPLILVLNKIDLVSLNTVEAWKGYFHGKFPELHVVCFTRYPLEHVTTDDGTPLKTMMAPSNRKRRLARALGIRELLKACGKVVVRKQGILVDWEMLIREHAQEEQQQEYQLMTSSDSTEEEETIPLTDVSDLNDPPRPTNSDYITLGTIGQPNVGKSSLINGLLGRKLVSVSKTPGHTKHFQTIYLTRNVRLCDCPGLVFPTYVPKTLQILTGVFPIAQVQEPYSVIQYLAELCPIEKYLNLKHPDMEGSESQSFFWSAWAICEGKLSTGL